MVPTTTIKPTTTMVPTTTIAPIVSQIYPPIALSADTTILSTADYGNGTYIVSTSGKTNRSAYYVFDKDKTDSTTDNSVSFNTKINQYEDCLDSNKVAIANCGYYLGTNYTTDATTGTNYYGDWIQIQLPDSICLSKMVLNRRWWGSQPRDCQIFGSSDGTIWYAIGSATNLSYPSNNESTVYTSVVQYYNYFRLAVNRVAIDNYSGNVSAVALRELELWGYLPSFSGYLFLYGSDSDTTKLSTVSQITINSTSKTQWETQMTSYPSSITPPDVAVIMDNISGVLTFKFQVPDGTYNINARCLVPGGNSDSFLVQVDTYNETIFSPVRLTSISTTSVFITVSGINNINIPFTKGEHQVQFKYREPTGLVGITITRLEGQFTDVVIPAINTLLYPDKIYGTQELSAYTTTLTPTTTIKPTTTIVPTTTIKPTTTMIPTTTLAPTTLPPNVVRFPPSVMTSSSQVVSGMTYGNGTYDCSSSNGMTWSNLYKLFDGITTASIFFGANSYSTSNGEYVGTTSTTDTLGNSYSGNWVQIKLPNPISLYIVYMYCYYTSSSPRDIIILASNNATEWNKVFSGTNLNYENTKASIYIGSSVAYIYYRFVVQSVGYYSYSDHFSLSELMMYGTEYMTTSIAPTTTIKPSFPFPPTSLTSNYTYITGQMYGNGSYFVSTSSNSSTAYYAFSSNTAVYSALGSGYNTNGTYGGTTTTLSTNNTSYSGEWIQIEFPSAISVSTYTIVAKYDQSKPLYIALLGSNDNNSWVLVYENTSALPYSNLTTTININSNQMYYTYRLVVERLGNENTTNNYATSVISKITITGESSQTMTFSPSRMTTTIAPTTTMVPTTTIKPTTTIAPTTTIQPTTTSKPSYKYPPSDFTSSSSTISDQTYGNGAYTVSVSGPGGSTNPWMAFSSSNTDMITFGNAYNSDGTGAYLGSISTTDINGNVYNGAYIQIILPVSIILNILNFTRRWDANRPRDYVVLGSTDGLMWNLLSSATASYTTSGEWLVLNSNVNYYNYYRVVVKSIGYSGYSSTTAGVLNMALYTYSSSIPTTTMVPTTTIKPTTTLVPTTTIKPTTTMVPATITWFKFDKDDLTGTSVKNYGTLGDGTIAPTGATISTTEFRVGTGSLQLVSSYMAIPDPTFTTNGLTITSWFNYAPNTTKWVRLFEYGNGPNSDNFGYCPNYGLFLLQGTQRITSIQGVGNGYADNTWHHIAITMTYADVGSATSATKIYIDGKEIYSTTTGYYPAITPRTQCYIGKSNWSTDIDATGYVDDFRVYNYLISESEIKSIYMEGLIASPENITIWLDASSTDNWTSGTWKNFAEGKLSDATTYSGTWSASSIVSNSINGLPALYFNGTNSLSTTDPAGTYTSGATIFVVFKPTATDTKRTLVSRMSSTSIPQPFSVVNNTRLFGDGITTSTFYSPLDIGILKNQSSFIFAYRVNVSSLNVIQVSEWLNGSPQYYDMKLSAIYSDTQTIVSIGSGSSTTSFTGYIGEVIVCKTSISDSEITAITKYLSSKWSISISPSSSYLKARYVSIERVASEYINLSEIQIFDKNGSYLTPTTSTATSTYGNNITTYGSQNLYDRDYNTIYHSASRNATDKVILDLGTEYEIGKVIVFNRDDIAWERLIGAALRMYNGAGKYIYMGPTITTSSAVYEFTFAEFTKNISIWLDSSYSSNWTGTTWSNLSCNKASDATNVYGTWTSASLVSNIINGNPAMYFSKNALGTTDPAGTYSSGLTLFVVFRCTASNTYQTLVSRTSSGTYPSPFDMYNTTRNIGNGTNLTSYTSQYNLNTITTSANLFVFRIESTSTGANATELLNGVYQYLNTKSSYYGDTVSEVIIGSRRPTGTTFFTGYIGEIIMYKTPLSYTEMSSVNTYLSTKWGLTLNSIPLTNLKIWLDASTLTSGSLTTWTNMATNKSSDATIVSGTFTVESNVINGLPALKFGNTSILKITDAVNTYSTGITMFVVFRPSGTDTYRTLLSRTYTNSYPSPFDMYNTSRAVGNASVYASMTSPFNLNDAANLNKNFVFTLRLRYVATEGRTYITEWKNGTTVLNSSGLSTSNFKYGDNVSVLYIGGRQGGGTTYTGYMGEVITYSTSLSDNEVVSVNGYLMEKWGIS